MTNPAAPNPGSPRHPGASDPGEMGADPQDGASVQEMFSRMRRGLAATLGLAAIGVAAGIGLCAALSTFGSQTTSMRVAFSFKDFGKGQYPDHSNFQPDDIRSPDVVTAALKRQNLDSIGEFAEKIRSALTIEGVISPIVIKERDRLRAAGQSPAPFLPDEYIVTLTLPRKFPLSPRQRELLLDQIVNSYLDKFQSTYAELPSGFGSAFESLQKADYFEFELVLDKEVENIVNFLSQQLDQAKTFRSVTTNLSFNDLVRQTDIFSQIQLSETLGLIRQNGLSNDRAMAMVKMDYYLQTLEDQEELAVEEEKVVDDLLAKTQDRSQNYVLGIKSQAAQQRSDAPILDQGLIDSLVANDSTNFLVHQALEAGLKVKRVQADESRLRERRKSMEQFLKADAVDQSVITARVKVSLAKLESSYQELISNIRKTHLDFARQQFANAIRVTMEPSTESVFRPLMLAGVVGGFIGFSLGLGLSLLGVRIGPRRA
jgi:hypothetical protein